MREMPKQTQDAVNWALGQKVVYEEFGFVIIVSKDTPTELVEKVCDYFDNNGIEYGTFDYYDLLPYLD